MFFAEAQNKFLYAVTGHTAAEIIMQRADSSKENMGLTSWDGRRVNKADVIRAKNYLLKDELEDLNRIVTIFLDQAEFRAKRRQSTKIVFWKENIDLILTSNDLKVLDNKGKRSAIEAESFANAEYEKFKLWRRRIAAEEADREDAETLKTNWHRDKRQKTVEIYDDARYPGTVQGALIDMDGVLFDSMKGHTRAWQEMMRTAGVECDRDEFYLYEGMTGKATIDLLFRRTFGHGVSDEEAKRLYAIKTERFRSYGPAPLIEGADRMLRALGELGLIRVLVTGSAQSSLLDNIDRAYPGVFPPGRRITANDVTHGKPNPEPYLKGAAIAGSRAEECIVVENAPLSVRARAKPQAASPWR